MKKVALIQLVLTLMVFFHLKSELISVQVDTKINSIRHDNVDKFVYRVVAKALLGKCVYNSERNLEFHLMKGKGQLYHVWPRELICKNEECKIYNKEKFNVPGHYNAVSYILAQGELVRCDLGLLRTNKKALEN